MNKLDPSWPCCPNPTHGSTRIPLDLVEVETKDPVKDEIEAQHGEFIGGPQAKYICRRCCYAEIYKRDHLEHREAAEADRSGDTMLKWPPS